MATEAAWLNAKKQKKVRKEQKKLLTGIGLLMEGLPGEVGGQSLQASSRMHWVNTVERTPYHVRVLCSILAITICWGIGGVVFCLLVKGSGTLAAWTIWGGGVCFVGWVLVGVPLVAAGDRIYRMRPAVLALGVGLSGVLIMSLPYLVGLLTNDFGAEGHIVRMPGSTFWKFEGSAFAIASVSALLYRSLLTKSHASTSRSERSH